MAENEANAEIIIERRNEIHAPADNSQVFVYNGGNQAVPHDLRCVRIDKCVKIIPNEAFINRRLLVHVKFHDGVERIKARAFCNCTSLISLKLPGVKVVEAYAFYRCKGLTEVEFGDKLDRIGQLAFANCTALTNIKMPSVRTIDMYAFHNCSGLTDVDLQGVENIGPNSFQLCTSLTRITIPLKPRAFQKCTDLAPVENGVVHKDAFIGCNNLFKVDLLGETYCTISSLHMESWKDEINDEIGSINRALNHAPIIQCYAPTRVICMDKAITIQQWMVSVHQKIEHYKAEHCLLLKEVETLLELAMWKAKLGEKGDISLGKLKIDATDGIVLGADFVIENVLPFLRLV